MGHHRPRPGSVGNISLLEKSNSPARASGVPDFVSGDDWSRSTESDLVAPPPGRRRSGTGLLGAVPLTIIFAVLGAFVVVSALLGVAYGSVPVSLGHLSDILWSKLTGSPPSPSISSGQSQIVWELRVPRVLLAAIVGATLTSVGTAIQALVRNALADPFILGVSSGASVGATTVLLFGAFASFGVYALSVGSFIGAIGAMAVVYVVASHDGHLSPLRLVLAGVASAFMFQALTSFLVFQGDPRATRVVMFWLLGSLGRASWGLLVVPSIVLAVGVIGLLSQARTLNALVVGEDTATALGIDVRRTRTALFVLTSLMTGVVVAVSGAIGFVGLVLPHVVRLLVGSDHRKVIPVGVLLGAAFMIWGDLLARVMVAPQEMPIGVITAFVGAPVFLLLIHRDGYAFGGSR